MCSHEILKYVRAKPFVKDVSHSVTTGADVRGGAGSKLESENDENKLRDTKGGSDV